uniref:CARD domain-containing protein n=1 Tax=Erpetoichthys calabaricus TaxID=27687 RepID=A0A8C4RG57_ERPCA
HKESTARAFIQSKKCELISCFQNDSSYILQKAHSKDLLAQHEYQRIKSTTDPVERTTDLLDVMLVRGEDSCKVFQDMLAEVLDTYPQLSNLLEQPPAPPGNRLKSA